MNSIYLKNPSFVYCSGLTTHFVSAYFSQGDEEVEVSLTKKQAIALRDELQQYIDHDVVPPIEKKGHLT